MKRRNFVGLTAIGGIGLMFPFYSCFGGGHKEKVIKEITGFQK